MSEWYQMTELDNLSKSETPNLAALHCLACTGSYSSEKVVNHCNLLKYKILYTVQAK